MPPSPRIRVWDLPIRLFHWALVVCVAAAIVTGLIGGNWMEVHGRFGIAIAGLLTFRVLWGVVGSQTARFSQFVRGPGAILAYLRGEWRGVGHNPLGALSVLALLGLFGVQAVTGLFGNDDIAFNGPLRPLVDKAFSDALTGYHSSTLWFMIGLLVLHIGAVVFYRIVRGHDLLTPMIRGTREASEPGEIQPREGSPLALALCVLLTLGILWLAAGGLVAPPPPPAPTPAW